MWHIYTGETSCCGENIRNYSPTGDSKRKQEGYIYRASAFVVDHVKVFLACSLIAVQSSVAVSHCVRMSEVAYHKFGGRLVPAPLGRVRGRHPGNTLLPHILCFRTIFGRFKSNRLGSTESAKFWRCWAPRRSAYDAAAKYGTFWADTVTDWQYKQLIQQHSRVSAGIINRIRRNGFIARMKRLGYVGCDITVSIGVGAGGGDGIGPPLLGLGDNPPPTLCCNIGKKYQNLLIIA